MKTSLPVVLSLVIALLLVTGVPAFAHHGTFVSYDSEHQITLKATMTEFHFTNPTCRCISM